MRHPKHEPELLNFPWKWVELWIERPLGKALEAVDACWRAELASGPQSQRFREARAAIISALQAVEETRRLIYWLYPGNVTHANVAKASPVEPHATELHATATLRPHRQATRQAAQIHRGSRRPSPKTNKRARRQ